MSTPPTERRPRILIVDDDAAIRDVLSRALADDGFSVTTSPDGAGGLRLANAEIDVVILDVDLPDINGRDMAARLRACGVTTPIIMLSGLDQLEERIAGLEAGADDYLVKPFSVEELSARIRALARRTASYREAPDGARGVALPLRVGRLLIDVSARRASWDGQDLRLTQRELSLLEMLARSPGVVRSREHLLETVWGYDFGADTKVIGVFISHLRRKLDGAGAPPIITTVRGAGFRLERS